MSTKPLKFTVPVGSKAVLPLPKQEGEIRGPIHDFRPDLNAPKEKPTGEAPKFKKVFPTVKAGRRSKKRKTRRTRRQWKSTTRGRY